MPAATRSLPLCALLLSAGLASCGDLESPQPWITVKLNGLDFSAAPASIDPSAVRFYLYTSAPDASNTGPTAPEDPAWHPATEQRRVVFWNGQRTSDYPPLRVQLPASPVGQLRVRATVVIACSVGARELAFVDRTYRIDPPVTPGLVPSLGTFIAPSSAPTCP